MPREIKRSEAFALLVEACHGARAVWEAHEREREGEEAPYLGMGVLARHLDDLRLRGEIACFPQVFAIVERLINEGDEEVRDLAVFGFLESLQNISSWSEQGHEAFSRWLGPVSLEAWHELEGDWNAEREAGREEGSSAGR
jgi:hypothetical protein